MRRAIAEARSEELEGAVVEGEHPVTLRLAPPQRRQLLESLGLGVGQVGALGGIGGEVVELPGLGIEVGPREVSAHGLPTTGDQRPAPAVLEVLERVGRRSRCVVEDLSEGAAGHRELLDPVVDLGSLDVDQVVDRRRDVGDMDELSAQAAALVWIDAGGPVDDEGNVDAALVGVLLVPTERGVAGLGPPPRVVGVAVRPTDVIDALHGLLGRLEDAVEELHLMHHAVGPALLGRAVVGEDHEDGVVESAETSEAVHEPTDLGVGVVEEGGERLLESRGESTLDLGELFPGLDAGITGRETRVRGHDAHLDLTREPSIAHRVPAVVEAPPILLHELPWRLMRGMGRAEGQVEEHRSIGADADRVGVHRERSIDQILREVVTVLWCRRGSDHVVVGDQIGMELVGLAVQETVEAIEAATEGPLIEGSGRRALLDRR